MSPSSGGNPCGAEIASVPTGVCELDDGTLIAFGDLEHDATCAPSAGEASFSFTPHHCTGGGPKRRVVAHCGDAASEVFFARGVGSAEPERFVLGARCAIGDSRIASPVEAWRPFIQARELCMDPYAWCGSPIVLELREPDGDPCGGGMYTQRCHASAADGRIILRAETSRAVGDACFMPALVDRVATCVVPPLAAGSYEVLDQDGRTLGRVEVPAEQPEGELEPTCTPIP